MTESRIAGRFLLKSAKLMPYDRSADKTVDIKNIILGFTISESMSRSAVHGFTTLFDGNDLMTKFPLRGEEYLQFEYEDYYGNTRKDLFFVYSISDISYPDDKNPSMLRYTLNFVSVPKVFSESNRIMKAYTSRSSGSGLISDYAEEIFSEYYRRPQEERGIQSEFVKDLIIEDTAGTQDVVIPNMTPEESMQFLSRRAFNEVSATNTYRFFENRDKFYFVTNEEMERIASSGEQRGDLDAFGGAGEQREESFVTYHYTYMPSQNPNDQDALQQTLINVDFKQKVHTINDINTGAYEKTIYELDLMNGTIMQMPVFDYLDAFYDNNFGLVHTERFVSENVDNKFRRFILKDWASDGAASGPELRNNTYMTELYAYKNTFMYHYRQNSISVTGYGRNDVVAGSVVLLDVLDRKVNVENPSRDMQRSGLYFVESVDNVFYENTYTQKMTLSRYGVSLAGGGGEVAAERVDTGDAVQVVPPANSGISDATATAPGEVGDGLRG